MTKLRIAIDGNEANVAQRVGSNAYAYEILHELEELTREDENVEVTVLLADRPGDFLPAARRGWVYQVCSPHPLWTQIALPLHLFFNQKKYDVLYTPGHYAPRVSFVPYVSSVMDLAFLHFPKQFRAKDTLQLTEWTRYSVRHATKVVVISEYTKKDVMEQYGLPAEKIVVAYPGIHLDEKTTYKEKERVELFKKFKIKNPYLLYIGTLQPRKNLVRLIEAFESLYTDSTGTKKRDTKRRPSSLFEYKLEDLQLVIAGKVGWLAEPILEKIKSSPVKNRIILTGFVSEEEKAILYKESVATVLVGLYEGFGMPALEALSYGSVPIVSSTTSLPEVIDEAGIQVDPYNVSQIAEGLKEVLEMPAKERARILKKGRQQLKKFQWRTSAEVILQTLKGISK